MPVVVEARGVVVGAAGEGEEDVDGGGLGELVAEGVELTMAGDRGLVGAGVVGGEVVGGAEVVGEGVKNGARGFERADLLVGEDLIYGSWIPEIAMGQISSLAAVELQRNLTVEVRIEAIGFRLSS